MKTMVVMDSAARTVDFLYIGNATQEKIANKYDGDYAAWYCDCVSGSLSDCQWMVVDGFPGYRQHTFYKDTHKCNVLYNTLSYDDNMP